MRPIVAIMVFLSLFSCNYKADRSLPILGETTVDHEGRTVHYRAPDFLFVDQRNQSISEEKFEGKIHVVDFFFTSCPTICPMMTTHLTQIQEHFKEDNRVGILSYSIDPQHDTPQKLEAYAQLYDIDPEKWSMLTGASTDVFELAKDYKVMAFDDSVGETPNLIHDGTFVLVDGQRRIRGYYNGLEQLDVHRLIEDIELLLKES